MKSDMSPEENAIRAAAFIDGEGTIGIRKSIDKRWSGSINYTLAVAVTNTDERLAHWLHQTFGGNFYHEELKNPKHKRKFIWSIHNKPAEEFLMRIYPYLLLKRRQAQTAFFYMNRNYYENEETFYLQMKELNKRGT